ncbi:MAG: phosphotransferase family protein [Gammaproteobacteria bacterium]|nr:phosphotransferase family protein [Gammaproteobacteria bacterium]
MNAAALAVPPPAALALVPGLEAGAVPSRLERLEGGLVNDSWRVATPQGHFVLRVDGPAWRRPGVERARERLIHGIAAGAGLAPAVLVWSEEPGAQVREYLEGRVWVEADMQAPGRLQRLGVRLAALHALGAPQEIAPFDPGACAQQYLQQVVVTAAAGNRAGRTRADTEAIAEARIEAAAVQAAAARVAAHGARAAIIHGDLTPSNLVEGRNLWLLDWEYAQCADPMYDLACLLAYCPAARQHQRLLLAAAGLEDAVPHERLRDAIRVYEGLTRLWHLARDTGARAGLSAN